VHILLLDRYVIGAHIVTWPVCYWCTYCYLTGMLLVHILLYKLKYISFSRILEKDVKERLAYKLWWEVCPLSYRHFWLYSIV